MPRTVNTTPHRNRLCQNSKVIVGRLKSFAAIAKQARPDSSIIQAGRQLIFETARFGGAPCVSGDLYGFSSIP
jgi:hypothetical protein